MSLTLDYKDFDWIQFVDELFKLPPCEPFSFSITFLDQLQPQQIPQLLGTMLLRGTYNKYGKEPNQLTPTEIDEIQKYFHSIGYKVEYEMIENHINITFSPYSQIHNTFNQPDKIQF